MRIAVGANTIIASTILPPAVYIEPDVDCQGSWLPCGSDCLSRYEIQVVASGQGVPCAYAWSSVRACDRGQDDCPLQASTEPLPVPQPAPDGVALQVSLWQLLVAGLCAFVLLCSCLVCFLCLHIKHTKSAAEKAAEKVGIVGTPEPRPEPHLEQKPAEPKSEPEPEPGPDSFALQHMSTAVIPNAHGHGSREMSPATGLSPLMPQKSTPQPKVESEPDPETEAGRKARMHARMHAHRQAGKKEGRKERRKEADVDEAPRECQPRARAVTPTRQPNRVEAESAQQHQPQAHLDGSSERRPGGARTRVIARAITLVKSPNAGGSGQAESGSRHQPQVTGADEPRVTRAVTPTRSTLNESQEMLRPRTPPPPSAFLDFRHN